MRPSQNKEVETWLGWIPVLTQTERLTLKGLSARPRSSSRVQQGMPESGSMGDKGDSQPQVCARVATAPSRL